MSQYNKTVLTNAGLELAKRANAGQAKFEITRAVTSADDWSNKTIQDIEAVTTIPNIMQQGAIMDTEEVESNNSVMGVSLCFTNKNLSAGYQIKIIGVYVKEEGQENDFLYAVTTAVAPEYMPDFSDEVLYRFNMQLYLVIGKAQAVNVVINDGASVTHKQFDNYKGEVTASLEKIENTHKEDMSHVAKSASINGGAEILPDSTGKLNLVVPDPDLSEYVSLEQLTEMLQAKADVTAVNKQIKAVTDLANTKANSADVYTKSEVDSKTSGTIITDYDIASKTPTKRTDRYNNKWLVDQQALGQFADQINQLKGRQTLDSPDFNSITNTGVYYITNNNEANMKNNPVYTSGVPVSQWGVLVVSSGKGQRISQVYYPDNNVPPFCRVGTGSTWQSWYELSTQNDIIKLQNAVNSKADKSQVNVGGNLFRMLPAGNTWNDILGFDNGDAPALVAFRGNSGGPMNNLLGNFSAGVAFGGGDTKGFLEVSYADHNARIGGGNGGAPVWHEDIAWKSDITNLQNKLAQYTVDYNNNYVHDTTIDFNSYLHETRTIKVANVKANNGPLANTATIWGWLTTYHWDDNSVTQEYRDAGGEVFWRATSASASRPWTWHKLATYTDITDLQNQIQQLKDNQFEVQTFTDATAAANWEAQRPGKRMAIVNK